VQSEITDPLATLEEITASIPPPIDRIIPFDLPGQLALD